MASHELASVANDRQYQTERKATELDQLIKTQVFFATHPGKAAGGVREKVEAKRLHLPAELDALEKELDELEAEQELVDKASVKIIKKIHEGVEMQIGKQKWQIKEDSGPGNYLLHDGHITII
ncbi:FapA family protein [Undibacterium sp. Di27W]|uniref:FapA family protein n=1 Tax=Undibacterium sp. Di27W TaxID=3413036 RepID=UPI003BF155AA